MNKKIALFVLPGIIVGSLLGVLFNRAEAAKLEEEDLQTFSQNNILFYDPSEIDCSGDGSILVSPTGENITWIGDSYSVGARKIIEEEFPGITFGESVENSKSYIQSNKGVSDRYGGGEANPPALAILKRIIDAGELKLYLVMAVGTNAGWTDEEVEEFENIMSSHPETKVVFVNAKARAHLMADDMGTNERLRALADSNDNYYLADWAAAYSDSYFVADTTHPSSNGGYEKWVEVIKEAMPRQTMTNGKSVGTGNYSQIMTAKNANETFFNGSGTVQSARWSDTDTESMKRLLETYGDLAYQLGDVTGAPWIALLVQMRYEDPESVCGRNNFWGNGCDSAHAYAGGATKQGNTLGEGFMQYAETLLETSLDGQTPWYEPTFGITDPIEYLETIGPLWVQGSKDGAGYGNIAGMRNSVKALTDYVNTPEGQAIVQEFGNYHGIGNNSNPLCRCRNGDFGAGKWEDGWLVEDSISGLIHEDVTARGDLKEPVNPVGSYITSDGKPNKILLHSTEGHLNGFAAYGDNKYPAHFTIDPRNKTASQHFSIYQPALAIANYDQAGPIQIEIVGYSDPTSAGYTAEEDLRNFSDEDWDYLAMLLQSIANETGIPLTSTVSWADGTPRLSVLDFIQYEGILGHMHAPGNNHSDPHDIWDYVEAAIERNGGYDEICDTSGNGDINATALELAWPEYGQHGWNDPSPAYAKALAETGVNKLGDRYSMAGGSCDAFVATVMRYSGADPDFHCCGVSGGYVENYLKSSGKYEVVPNGLGSLQPGDIRIGPHHIELYVEVNGEPHIAAASHASRSGDIGDYYDNDFRVYRLKK